MNGLILDGLKTSNLTKMTEDRIQKMTMTDLAEILNSMEESDQKHLINAIKTAVNNKLTEKQQNNARQIIGNIIEMYTYRVMQKKVSYPVGEAINPVNTLKDAKKIVGEGEL